MKVAYQGVRGAYSESAAYKHFGKDAEVTGCDTFEDVFNSVKLKKADYGVIPVENTIAGTVEANYDLLLAHDVYVIAEIFLGINHHLLSHKGSSFGEIKSVYSHPHALEQCMDFIRKNKLKPIPEYDTAGSAKIVKEQNKKGEAAIASELCAQIYGLDVIRKGISSAKNVVTRFFVFVNPDKIPKNISQEKTSISFKSKHYPGALVSCLQRLSKHGINLTKLESRPVPESPWEYVFYADFEGGIEDENVKLALSEMEAASDFLKILGSYPKGEKD